jgi:hypothetical protein
MVAALIGSGKLFSGDNPMDRGKAPFFFEMACAQESEKGRATSGVVRSGVAFGPY